MDQRIGIDFHVSGVERTIRKIRTVARALTMLNRVAMRSVQGIAAATSTISMNAQNIGAAATAITAASGKMGTAGRKMGRFGAMVAGQQQMRRSRVGYKRIPKAGGMTGMWFRDQAVAAEQTRSMFGGGRFGGRFGKPSMLDKLFKSPIMGAPGFMFRFMAWHAAIRAIGTTFVDLMLGGVRQSIDRALVELKAVSFSRAQQEKAYMAGQNLARRTGLFTTEQFIEAMSEVASSLSIKEIGFGPLQRAATASMYGAVLTKMAPEQMGRLIATTYAATTGMPEFKGMGVGEKFEKITAQIVKAVEITQAWGADFANAFRYLLPQFKEMGWSLARTLAFIGTYKTVGFHAGQIGRYGRYMAHQMMPSMVEVFGRKYDIFMEVAGTPEQKKQKKQFNEYMRLELRKMLMAKMQTDGDKLLVAYSEALKSLIAKGIDPIKHLKVSTRWMTQILAFSSEHRKMMEKAWKELQNATFGEILGKVNEMAELSGRTLERLSANWQFFWQSLELKDFATTIGRYSEVVFGAPGQARKLQEYVMQGWMSVEEVRADAYTNWVLRYGQDYADMLMDIVTAKGPIKKMWATVRAMAYADASKAGYEFYTQGPLYKRGGGFGRINWDNPENIKMLSDYLRGGIPRDLREVRREQHFREKWGAAEPQKGSINYELMANKTGDAVHDGAFKGVKEGMAGIVSAIEGAFRGIGGALPSVSVQLPANNIGRLGTSVSIGSPVRSKRIGPRR